MTYPFLTFASLTVIATVTALLLWNVATKRWDALSWRNMFLVGFGYYMGLSALGMSQGLTTGPGGTTGEGSTLFGLALLVFLAVFLACAWWGRRRPLLTKLLPKLELPITGAGILGLTSILLACSVALSIIPADTYLLGALAMIRGPVVAGTLGLATYYLVVRRFNPLAWAVFLTVLALTLVVAAVGTGGRRVLLSALFAIPWVFYFSSWRYRRPAANYWRLGAGVAIGVLGVLVYTPFRHQGAGNAGLDATFSTRAEQFVSLIQDPFKHFDSDFLLQFVYSDAGPNTLFILENYPGSYAHKPLAAAYWIAVNPIPRQFWPDKPLALGIIIQKQMNADANLGPGIIGHGWFEGGMLGVAAYAAFFGLLVGVFDRALAQRAWNPYFVVFAGSHLGNIFGLARGDTGLFFMEILLGLFGCGILMTIFKLVFGKVAAAFPPLPAPVDIPPEFLEPAPDDGGDFPPAGDETGYDPEERERAYAGYG